MGQELSLQEQIESRGISEQEFRTLQSAVWPNAASNRSVLMAYDYCRARGLDPFKKPVHIVPVYDKNANGGEGGLVDTVRPGIAELRTTAMRTGEYMGRDEVRFGSDVEVALKDKGGNAITYTVPEYAQVTVYRRVHGQVVPFPGDPVYWLEAYATEARNSEVPNEMWRKRRKGQIAKVAEAMALRQAFPEELGADNTAEEMEGRDVSGAARHVEDEPASGQGHTASAINEQLEQVAIEHTRATTADDLAPTSAEPAEAEAVDAEWSPGKSNADGGESNEADTAPGGKALDQILAHIEHAETEEQLEQVAKMADGLDENTKQAVRDCYKTKRDELRGTGAAGALQG